MDKPFNHLTLKFLTDDSPPPNKSICDSSLFLSNGFQLNLSRIVAQISDVSTRAESLGHILGDIPPDNGSYRFDIATELPYFLPSFEGHPEHVINVNDEELMICNRMVRLFFVKGGPADSGLDYMLVHRLGLEKVKKDDRFSGECPVLPMKSFVSRSYTVSAKSAEAAIHDNFINWREQLILSVSSIIRSLRACAPEPSKYLASLSSVNAFPLFWLSVQGAGGRCACEQFSGFLGLSAFKQIWNLNTADSSRFEDFFKKNNYIEPFREFLALAYSSLFYEDLPFAVIHTCISVESFLGPFIRPRLLCSGISNTKLDDIYKDVSYSELLNIILPLVVDVGKITHFTNLLGHLNWARKVRNDIVHKGRPSSGLTRDLAKAAVDSASSLLEALENINTSP